VPNTEENMNMVLLIPKNEETIAHQNMHALIRTTLNVRIFDFNVFVQGIQKSDDGYQKI
jgi:hypothetical protein